MKYFLLFVFMLFGISSYCQFEIQNENETAEQFAARMMPENSILVHKVLSVRWNDTPAIIAFYEQAYKLSPEDDPDQQQYARVIAEIFLNTESNHYRKVIIDTFDTEGSKPVIESAFFANADKDRKKELIIIASWEQQHRDVSGILYATYIYDDVIKDSQMKLTFMERISKKLSGGCKCEWSDGTRKKVKYKNATEIKTELKHLGYK